MIHHRVALVVEVRGRIQVQTFQAGGGHRHRVAQFAQLHGGVGDHDIQQIDAPPQPLRAGIGSALGDAFHFFQDFAVETAQEKRVDRGAQLIPALGFGLGPQLRGATFHIFRNLARHQIAVLVAALIRLAFDVQIDPAGRGIPVRRAERAYGCRGRVAGGRGFIQGDAREPRLSRKCAAIAHGQQNAIFRAAGHEA